MNNLLIAAMFALPLSPPPAAARQSAACVPVVRDAWVRLVPGGMPMQSAYGRIENHCRVAVDITGVTSPVHGSAMFHQSSVVNGVNRMRMLSTLHLAPGASAVLQPGGSHIMLMDAGKPLEAGTSLPLTFRLKDGRTFTAGFEVRNPAL